MKSRKYFGMVPSPFQLSKYIVFYLWAINANVCQIHQNIARASHQNKRRIILFWVIVVVVIIVPAYSYSVCSVCRLTVYYMHIRFHDYWVHGCHVHRRTHNRNIYPSTLHARTAHTKGFEYSIFFSFFGLVRFGSSSQVPFAFLNVRTYNVHKCNRVMPYKHIKRK